MGQMSTAVEAKVKSKPAFELATRMPNAPPPRPRSTPFIRPSPPTDSANRVKVQMEA